MVLPPTPNPESFLEQLVFCLQRTPKTTPTPIVMPEAATKRCYEIPEHTL